MKKVELLAPAGSFEALEAAVMCGADAVYLGGTKFGARAFASNFNDEEMVRAISFAHLYGVRIYVTVNTLVYDEEVSDFIKYIGFLDSVGVDAFIIQDLGMLHLLSTIYPNLELHASTQMHIHNIEALNRLKDMGVKRAVLPRELSIEKVSELKKESGMDIEIFVHGALCVSYSGQCLMSYVIGGRSGNRGECAGSCRLPYKLVELDDTGERIIDTKGDYILSPKDLYTLENVSKLIESGIDSMKIEGRMKRPEYVALVTTLYRRAIDSYYAGEEYQVSESDIKNLMMMFNRGFTKGYLFGDRNKTLMNQKRPNHMGVPIGKVTNFDTKYITVKLDDDITVGDGIRIISKNDIGFTVNKIYKKGQIVKEAYKGDIVSFDNIGDVKRDDIVVKTTDFRLLDNLKTMYNHNNRKISLKASIYAYPGSPLKLVVSDGINEVIVESDMKIEHALNNPVTKDKLLEKLNKIGDTPFVFESINVNLDDDIFIPLTAINAVKREALDKISAMRVMLLPKTMGSYKLEPPKIEQNKVLIKAKVKTLEQYQACIDNNIDQIYVENFNLYQKVKNDNRVILALSRVRKTKLLNDKEYLAGDFGSVGKNTITDFSLNAVNAYTVAFMHSLGANTVTLSYEMKADNIERLIKTYKDRYAYNPNLEVIIYGRLEAMISEYCLLSTYINNDGKSCGVCKENKRYRLRDRFNNDFVLSFDNCLMSIYDYKKRNIIKEIKLLKNLGINNFRLNFVDEDYKECSKIIKEVMSLHN